MRNTLSNTCREEGGQSGGRRGRVRRGEGGVDGGGVEEEGGSKQRLLEERRHLRPVPAHDPPHQHLLLSITVNKQLPGWQCQLLFYRACHLTPTMVSAPRVNAWEKC